MTECTLCDCCKNLSPEERELRKLGLDIADQGGWEEFHQKRGNSAMQYYHKSRRLEMLEKYRILSEKLRKPKLSNN